jgi:uncharacterized OsmC-like protein
VTEALGARVGTASATYLWRERLLVELPHGTLVADHPERMGGDGRGPSAGELVLMAFTASAALAAGAAADGLAPGARITSRASFQTVRERIEGPLATLAHMAILQHRLEVAADADWAASQAIVAAGNENPIGRSLAAGFTLDERLEFERDDGPREDAEFVNRSMQEDERSWSGSPLGERQVAEPEPRWRVSATYVGAGVALVRHDHQSFVVVREAGGPVSGPTPHELLAASLSACTVFYVAHNTAFRSIPVRAIRAAATPTLGPDDVVTSMTKAAVVAGNLTDQEQRDIEFIAAHCYVGVTMQRGVEIRHSVEVTGAPGSSAAGTATVPACDDGACCIPDLAS